MSNFSAVSMVFVLIFVSAFNFVDNDVEAVELDSIIIQEMYTEVSIATNFTSHSPISVGDYTTCVILNDGNVSCWGDNRMWGVGYGQLGNGDLDSRYSSIPTQVQGLPSGDPAVQVAVGRMTICVLLESGRLFCWGAGSFVGDGTDEQRVSPTEVITDVHDVEVSKVVVAQSHACALIANGSVMCWGQQYEGKLGDGVERGAWDEANSPNYTLPLPDGRVAVDIGLDSHSTCVILDNGTLSCWGNIAYRIYGSGHYEEDRPNPGYSFGDGISVESISAYGGFSDGFVSGMCVALSNDSVTCWNGGISGSYSFSPHLPVSIAVGAGGSDGSAHVCILLSDHTLLCRGDNSHGQIGDGTWDYREELTLVEGFTVEDPVVAVGAGSANTCAVTSTGKAYCWGSNTVGAVGDGTSLDVYEHPVQIDSIPDLTHLYNHGWGTHCAIFSDGHLGCWGDNEWGMIGDGTTENRLIHSIYHHPISTFGGSVVDFKVKNTRACVLIDDGSIWCWEGSRNQGVTPSKVPQYGSSRFATSLAIGNGVACAVQSNGEVSCWGYGHFGALGHGSWDDSWEPTTVEVFDSSYPAWDVWATGGTMCALTHSHEVWCWGANYGGALGDGSSDYTRNTPGLIDLEEGLSVEMLLSTFSNFCILVSEIDDHHDDHDDHDDHDGHGVHDGPSGHGFNADVRCWGENYDASLGDGTRDSSSTPIQVPGLSGNVIDFTSNQVSSTSQGEEPAYCILLENQTMYCWGGLWDNEVPPNGPELFWNSTDIDGHTELSRGSPCLRFSSTNIWCWGYHNFIDSDYNRTVPTNVSSFGQDRFVQAPLLDMDGDGIPNLEDNCLRSPNPEQTDTDLDRLGDLCDDDDDDDGFTDEVDDCPHVVGSSEIEGQVGCPDLDGDGVLDSDDACPNTTYLFVDEVGCAPDQIDTDGDGVVDLWDLCQGHSDQIDVDDNGIPDGCDDSDGDGVLDSLDICPEGDDNSDLNQDGVPDDCEEVTQQPDNSTNQTTETIAENETQNDQANSTSESDSDVEGSSDGDDSVWIYVLIAVCLVIGMLMISLFFISRKKDTPEPALEDDVLSLRIEAYTNQLVALGYDAEYARTYATQFFSTNQE